MGAILLVIGVLIILYNLIINLSNVTIIIRYCLGTNTLDEYWNLYFKNCFSARAIYSSIFGLILAIFLFIILIPIILIRRILFAKKMGQYQESGLVFKYDNSQLPAGTTFYSNCNDYGFAINKVEATGEVAQDMEKVILTLTTFGEENNIEIKYDIMKEIYILSTNETVYAPLNIFKEEKNYPVYLLYDDKQIERYKKVKLSLAETAYNDTIYFSTKNF